jgi:D-arabinose 1-dehydrogenase-like Zn-dependent alcohol dehydrogenase
MNVHKNARAPRRLQHLSDADGIALDQRKAGTGRAGRLAAAFFPSTRLQRPGLSELDTYVTVLKSPEAAMSKMRAMIVPELRGRFRMEERDLPIPARHEVRIRVHACGVCHSDSVTVEGLMPGLTYPRVPGHEVIGVIDALGPDVDGWKVGARVGVGWFGGSCGHCPNCRRGDAFACENIHGATGVTRDGGYADSEDTLLFSQLNSIASMNEVFPLEQAQAAYDRMMSGKARFRVVLKIDS